MLWPGRRPARGLLLLVVVLICQQAVGYQGGYFKYGTLSWKQTKIEADGIMVKFTLKTAWDSAFFSRGMGDEPWGNCVSCANVAKSPNRECDNFPATKLRQTDCLMPIVGDVVAIYDAVDTSDLDNPSPGGALPPLETTFSFGDKPSEILTGGRQQTARKYTPKCRTTLGNSAWLGKCIEGIVVDSFDETVSTPTPEADARDTTYVVSEMTYKYEKKTATYLAGFQGCCRMGTPDDSDGSISPFYDLKNNANGAWFLRAKVSVTDNPTVLMTGTAASPFIAHTPHLSVIKGRPLEFKVHAFDAASRHIKYSLGSDDDHGVGLNQAARPPYGNNFLAKIDEDTGVVTFPASASTSYENYYNLVVIATVYGPCTGYVSTANSDECFKPGFLPQTAEISTIVDFLIRVVQAGFTGDWPQSRCDNPNSGLPIGTNSQVCNNMPVLSMPPSPQRFICNELNRFQVTATDNSRDYSITKPKIVAIRHRQRPFLTARLNPNPVSLAKASVIENIYPRGQCSDPNCIQDCGCTNTVDCMAKTRGVCTNNPYVPNFPLGDDPVEVGENGNRAVTTSNMSTAVGTYSWTPLCERLETDSMYSYLGNHRLDVFGVCFVAVDDGGGKEFNGKLTSPPGCVDIAVLRCTKPTIDLIGMSKPASNASLMIWKVDVSTNVTLLLNGTDDTQSRSLTVFHTAGTKFPAVGAVWRQQQCRGVPSLEITCNPVMREFYFGAELVHAGFVIEVCFEAVNDQLECPRYRKNRGSQAYGSHASPVGPSPPITVSQASEPLCVKLDVTGPNLAWMEPTPKEGEVVLTYMGCPLTVTLVTEDLNNIFDVQIVPWTEEYSLPDGISVSGPQCYFRPGVPKPSTLARGVGSCPGVSRTLTWIPARTQSGLMQTVCIDSATLTTKKLTRCFIFHVSKCRYCAQAGETLQSLADSFYTDWLQIWAANTHLTNPHNFKLYQLVNIGAMYPAREADTLADLARRFRSDLRSLRLANPDVTSADQVLIENEAFMRGGGHVCILPGICNSAEYGASRSA